jgi:hypothetical protein
MGPFRIGSVGDAPGSLERLTVKEPQGRQTDRDAASATTYASRIAPLDIREYVEDLSDPGTV